jgi:hypothetical protein
MFLDESGKRYVLLDSKGSALTGGSLDAILPFVADHVQIDAAVVQRQGELTFLRIQSGAAAPTDTVTAGQVHHDYPAVN